MAITILFYSTTFLSYFSDNVNFSALELHLSIRGGEQCIVPAHADVGAGKKFRPALPDDDCAGFGYLAPIQFYASVLRITVSAVSRGALSLFMCHNKLPLINTNLNFPNYRKAILTAFTRAVQRIIYNFRPKF
jgi:hypothetical protein